MGDYYATELYQFAAMERSHLQARMLGMRQPHIARLEAGEHEPSLAMLARLARVLDMEFHIDITPSALRLTA